MQRVYTLYFFCLERKTLITVLRICGNIRCGQYLVNHVTDDFIYMRTVQTHYFYILIDKYLQTQSK